MRKLFFLALLVCFTGSLFAQSDQDWSFDLGGQYTWMSFTTPPTYSGSTGGVHGSVTYQKPEHFFGQLRSVYNTGAVSSSLTSGREYDWYTELVGGYCFSICPCWEVTPRVGLGFDFLTDKHNAYAAISAIRLNYATYYALVGVDLHYTYCDWSFGAIVDALIIYNQYLSIGGLAGAAWKMNDRWGVDVRLPVAYRFCDNLWIELAPYYRLLPVGVSSVLELPSRNLNQVGAFLTLRYYL